MRLMAELSWALLFTYVEQKGTGRSEQAVLCRLQAVLCRLRAVLCCLRANLFSTSKKRIKRGPDESRPIMRVSSTVVP